MLFFDVQLDMKPETILFCLKSINSLIPLLSKIPLTPNHKDRMFVENKIENDVIAGGGDVFVSCQQVGE